MHGQKWQQRCFVQMFKQPCEQIMTVVCQEQWWKVVAVANLDTGDRASHFLPTVNTEFTDPWQWSYEFSLKQCDSINFYQRSGSLNSRVTFSIVSPHLLASNCCINTKASSTVVDNHRVSAVCVLHHKPPKLGPYPRQVSMLPISLSHSTPSCVYLSVSLSLNHILGLFIVSHFCPTICHSFRFFFVCVCTFNLVCK